MDDGTAWFTKDQIARMLRITRQVVEHHLRRAACDGEIHDFSIRTQLRCAADGKYYQTRHYTLHVLFAVARRATSPRAKNAATYWRQFFASNPQFFSPNQAA